MKLSINVDDFGNSLRISEHILECCESPVGVDRLSIMPTGNAFKFAVDNYEKISRKPRISVHINLFEGMPCLPAVEIPSLVRPDGRFRHSFPTLLAVSLYGNRGQQERLSRDLHSEIDAQVRTVIEGLSTSAEIEIDGHQHCHMIPIVSDVVESISSRYQISSVRMPRERFFWCGGHGLLNYIGPNVMKHFLLNFLAEKARKKAYKNFENGERYFIGVLFTGNMSYESLVHAVRALEEGQPGENAVVDILLHPGGASKGEEAQWRGQSSFKAYYTSKWRAREKELFYDSRLVDLLSYYRRAL